MQRSACIAIGLRYRALKKKFFKRTVRRVQEIIAGP